ncbi:hypothetical protein, partial [Pseudomonas aeruginosa]|uniref:hypothetical protein n=1 Tax=Pseudomonas aeruginosa TaxID=287 RepID=UPI0012443E18
AKRIDIILRNASPSDHRRLADNEPLLMKLAKLESIRVLEAGDPGRADRPDPGTDPRRAAGRLPAGGGRNGGGRGEGPEFGE